MKSLACFEGLTHTHLMVYKSLIESWGEDLMPLLDYRWLKCAGKKIHQVLCESGGSLVSLRVL